MLDGIWFSYLLLMLIAMAYIALKGPKLKSIARVSLLILTPSIVIAFSYNSLTGHGELYDLFLWATNFTSLVMFNVYAVICLAINMLAIKNTKQSKLATRT